LLKKVLIISYYWPPSGGAGVQRWLKFTKYLRQFDWEPIIYTPLNPEFPEHDESLFKDIPKNLTILKTPIWEPYSSYKRFIGQKKEVKINTGFLSENKKKKFSENLSVWIRGNFFIPDARKFWIKPSIKYLNSYLKENPVDVIISTGPPHSLHMIALSLCKDISIPWLADFRDPWTNIDYYNDLKLIRHSDRKHRRMEREVLKHADAVTVVSRSMALDFNELFPRNYDVVTNGYDTDDIELESDIIKDQKFSISHIGTLVKTRNPVILWKVLSELVKDDAGFAHDLEIKLVGKVDFSAWYSLDEAGLKPFVSKVDYLPHSTVTRIQQKSQVLLLLINDTPNAKVILTGKFFEYLAARRPILCIAPVDGDAAQIMKETNSGLISGFKDKELLKQNILTFYRDYKKGTLISKNRNIDSYSRKALTKSLSKILNKLTKT
jgi:Glycosyltransferase Family 4